MAHTGRINKRIPMSLRLATDQISTLERELVGLADPADPEADPETDPL